MTPSFASEQDHPLVASVRRAAAANPYLAVELGATAGDGWVPWQAITEDDLRRWMAGLRHGDPDGVLQPDVAGSFLGAALAAAVVDLAVTMVTLDRRAPDISPEHLSVHWHAAQWFDRIGLASRRVAVLPDDPAAAHPDVEVCDSEPALHEWIAERAVACLEPALAGVRAIAPYGLGGLWGGVADEIARVVIAVDPDAAGLAAGIVEAVAARVPHIKARPRPVTLPGSARPLDLVVRSVCCLWYKTPAAHRRAEQGHLGYCLGCPLIDDGERVRRAASM